MAVVGAPVHYVVVVVMVVVVVGAFVVAALVVAALVVVVVVVVAFLPALPLPFFLLATTSDGIDSTFGAGAAAAEICSISYKNLSVS